MMSAKRMTGIGFGLAVATVVSGAACGPRSYGPPLPPHKVVGPTTIDAGVNPLARAHMATVASLRERAVGPLLARGPEGSLVAYVAGGGASRAVTAVPVGADGVPIAQARVVAQAAPETNALVARHTGGDSSGYVLAWTSLTDRGESISLVGVSDKGEPRGAAIELSRTADHVPWVDIVPTSRGALCLWAEEPPDGGANVLAQALDPSGKPRGVPSRVARGATGWQVVVTDGGVALGVVQSPRTLSLFRLDTEGRAVGEPIPMGRNVGDDMDLVRMPDSSILFAWTDRSRSDAQLVVAGIDAQNKVTAAHDALPDVGTSSLVALASGDGGALLLWEPTSRKREHAKRRVEAALVREIKAPLETRASFELAGGTAVEARGDLGGFGLLVTARVCPKDGGAACTAPAPTFVRLDASLTPVQSEALVQGPAVTLAWSLDCANANANKKSGCLALAAGPDAPTTVYSVDLTERPSTNAPPTARVLPADAPRLATASTLATGTQISDLASTKVGDTTLVAAIVGAGTDEKTHEERNALRVVPVIGGHAQAAVVLSTKALPTGGVAITSGPGADEATVAYASRDGAQGRVHLARIDAKGARKGGELVLGGGKGDASDVALAGADKGLIVAWVDTRDGNGEVYAAKVPADFSRPSREERITNPPGDATDTALAVAGGKVFLAWADPRESPHDGFADIYAVTLSPQTAKPLGKEGRVLSTAAHSRSPSLATTPQGVALAWIEEAPASAASDEAKGAMFVTLDENARPSRDPIKLHLRDEGVTTAIVLDATTTRLVHAVAARASQDDLWLDAVRLPLDPAGQLESFPLMALDGPSSLDVALSLWGDDLLLSDDGPEAADARVRRAQIAWRK